MRHCDFCGEKHFSPYIRLPPIGKILYYCLKNIYKCILYHFRLKKIWVVRVALMLKMFLKTISIRVQRENAIQKYINFRTRFFLNYHDYALNSYRYLNQKLLTMCDLGSLYFLIRHTFVTPILFWDNVEHKNMLYLPRYRKPNFILIINFSNDAVYEYHVHHLALYLVLISGTAVPG